MWTALPECDKRMQNIHNRSLSPATTAVNSPKSTSASSPGGCVCGTATSRRANPTSTFSSATRARTVDSATTAPSSSTSRCHTRRAVCRCLTGASRSSVSHRRTVTSCGPNTGEHRCGTFRGGGTASASAARTVRRCTRCLRASSRIDNPSSRRSRRIRSNCSTLDLSFTLHTSGLALADEPERRGKSGRGWGPNQAITTASNGAKSDWHTHPVRPR